MDLDFLRQIFLEPLETADRPPHESFKVPINWDKPMCEIMRSEIWA